jgi:RNA polymerase sigma factor (sigma-70 family)
MGNAELAVDADSNRARADKCAPHVAWWSSPQGHSMRSQRAGGEDVAVDPDEIGGLTRAAAGGDAAAWLGLVERFSGLVWSVIRQYRLGAADVADVFQTTWLRLAEHIGRIENPEHVGAWLATTARRESLRTARAATRILPTDDAAILDRSHIDDHSPELAVLDAEQAVVDSERAARLWRTFHQLSGRCRELLGVLMASPPPSYVEVAAALDMPVGSIGPTRARCLHRLRERLMSQEPDIIWHSTGNE